MTTFVSVGNATQPFTRLLDAVCSALPDLPGPVFVQHGAAVDFRCAGCEGAPFLEMEAYERRVAEAGLLVLHAGAGSIIHAIRARKVPVVVPRLARFGEHVDDHQVEFARELASRGRIVVCEEVDRLGDAARQALALQAESRHAPDASPLVARMRDLILQHVGAIDAAARRN